MGWTEKVLSNGHNLSNVSIDTTTPFGPNFGESEFTTMEGAQSDGIEKVTESGLEPSSSSESGLKPSSSSESGLDVSKLTEDDSMIEDESIVVKVPGEDFVLLNPSKSSKDEWSYRRPAELNGLPFWGLLDMYSGGGYLIPMRGSRSSLIHHMSTLRNQSWIDERSRALFAEFSAYNAQVSACSF